ncbi:chemotaxis protein CheW [Proteobacteria bacterium 005FR1]|nr:chemotaxis protein CheW [Proteobacteria bacterium 005FR1]
MAEPQTAFDALVDLAQRSRRSAKSLPSTVKVTPQWSGIGFSLLGQHFVAPIGEVSELLELPSYTRLPGVQPWVMGVANVRGRLLPLLDLAAFFGGRLEGQRKRQRVLVLEIDELYTGLVVDTALGMQHFPADSYSDELQPVEYQLRDYLAGSYAKAAGEQDRWYVFSPARLTEDPRFVNAAR